MLLRIACTLIFVTILGSLLSKRSDGSSDALVNMVPSSVLENASQNYSGPITTIPISNIGGQDNVSEFKVD